MRFLSFDIRVALRALARTPAFTAVALLTIALGVGVNTAMFSVVSATLLRPLPFRSDDGELVRLRVDVAAPGEAPDLRSVPATTFEQWRAHREIAPEVAAGIPRSLTLRTDDGAIRVGGSAVTPGFLALFRIAPLHGRAFREDEGRPGAEPVALLGFDLWRNQFGADRSVIGRVVTLNGVGHTIVGVAPKGFRHPYDADMWVPLQIAAGGVGGPQEMYVPARLAPGVSREAATGRLTQLTREAYQAAPSRGAPQGAAVASLDAEFTESARPFVVAVFGAAVVLLLIAATNIGGLVLARASERERELALRRALGASGSVLLRHALAQSVVLAAAGGVLGFITARVALPILSDGALISAAAVREFDAAPRLDLATFAFGFGVIAFVTVVGALVPLARSLAATPLSLLAGGGRSGSARGTGRVLGSLVATQIAVATALLVGAAITVGAFLVEVRRDRGFRPEGVLAFRVAFDDLAPTDTVSRLALIDRATTALAALPGVRSVGGTTVDPTYPGTERGIFNVPGFDAPSGTGGFFVHSRYVTPGYLGTMGIRVIEGRDLTAADRAEDAPVAVVSEALARRFWPGRSAVGERIISGLADDPNSQLTIVGVASDVAEMADVAGAPPIAGAWYLPVAQRPPLRGITFVLRTDGDPASAASLARATFAELAPDRPVYDLATMSERVSERLSPERVSAVLYGLFGWVGLTLAAVGLYGLMSYSVSRRTREFGIRLALGQTPGSVIAGVLARAAKLAGAGLGVGLALAWLAHQALAALRPDTRLPLSLALFAAPAALGAALLLAAYIPARRVAAVAPSEALRAEG